LGPLNVLIGPNGSGKSNLVEVVGLLKSVPTDFPDPIDALGGISECLWKDAARGTRYAWIEVVGNPRRASTPIRYALRFTVKSRKLAITDEFLADKDLLREYYGQHIGRSALPPQPNVELITKTDVEASLKQATRSTTKGPYQKSSHGFALLALIDPTKVRAASPHAALFFDTLARYCKE
jgi:hypothetical protein